MRSAKKYKLDQEAFSSLLTPFVLGVQCPKARTYHLYEYGMHIDLKDGLYEPRVDLQEVPHDKIVVLGMRKEFADAAQTVFVTAKQSGLVPEGELFDFLKSAIDSVKARGDKGIDRPAVLKVLQDGRVGELKRAS